MELIYTILSITVIILAVLLIILILMQRTKGAEIGAVFGSGAAAAVLGAGATTILTKLTYWLGGLFLFLIFTMSYIHHQILKEKTVINQLNQTQTEQIPAKSNSTQDKSKPKQQ